VAAGARANPTIKSDVQPAALQSGARSGAALLRIHFLLCRHFLIRDRQQVRNEPVLAHLLMFLLLGVTAAAVLQELKLDAHSRLTGGGNHIQRSLSTPKP
jgi:hypothetical protein